jgi:molybdate-binding protein
MVPRQAEAGSQILLEALLRQQQVDAAAINWLMPTRSESDAVLEVVEGRADATFGLASLAAQHRLGYVPVIDERYDILVDRREWFEPTWQSLFRFCQTTAFREHAADLAGYGIDDQFRVHFNAAKPG